MTKTGAKSRRDRMVIAIVVVVALYALAVLLWFTGRGQAWAAARKGYEKEVAKFQREKALIREEYHVSVGKGLKAQLVEEDHGGVWEMPVEVKYDNTSLQRLVEFLYAVNTAEDAMMDVREIEINAARGKNAGALHGKIVLTCAYLKGQEPGEGDSK